jgi:hypothetical protein
MNLKSAVVVGLLGAAIAGPASAQELSASASRDEPPASSGIELGVSTGYSQGFGKVADALPTLGDVSGAGGAVEVDIGYRVIPNLAIGAYVTGAQFSVPDSGPANTNQYSMSAGAQAVLHILPDRTWDPWVSLGTGWRGYWSKTDSVGTTARHGVEIGRLQAGVDYRLNDKVAISPLIGADLSVFVTEQTAGQSTWHNIQDPNVNTFLYGALAARFDVPTR